MSKAVELTANGATSVLSDTVAELVYMCVSNRLSLSEWDELRQAMTGSGGFVDRDRYLAVPSVPIDDPDIVARFTDATTITRNQCGGCSAA
jgi:hypothetical protein